MISAVSRINARSEENDFFVELDVHSELYPMLPTEKHRMLISNSLIINGSVRVLFFVSARIAILRISRNRILRRVNACYSCYNRVQSVFLNIEILQ